MNPSRDKEYTREYARKWYAANRDRVLPIIRQRLNDRRHATRKFVSDFKESSPCTDCGVFYPSYVMQLDHLRDKSFTISAVPHYSIRRIQQEIEKCELVCANCHAVRTHNRRSTPKEG